jgi:hypothetical protein
MTDAIDAAINDAEAKRMQQDLAQLEPRQAVEVPVLRTAHFWPGDAEITVDAMPDGPTMLLFDAQEGAFRAIILEPGTKWRIVPDKVRLWQPGQPA